MKNTLRASLPPMPERIKALPVDARGYPVPWFVAFIDGVPDFRVIRQNGIPEAYNKKRCWICGQQRGAIGAFVIGPMCAVNRVSSEPPSHLDCAIFSAIACPFLTLPKSKRRESGVQELKDAGLAHDPDGIHLDRNPGVALVWTSRDWKPFKVQGGVGAGILFDVGTPLATRWYAAGREATRAEIIDSIESGLPHLEAIAKQEGPAATRALIKQYNEAMKLLPTEVEC